MVWLWLEGVGWLTGDLVLIGSGWLIDSCFGYGWKWLGCLTFDIGPIILKEEEKIEREQQSQYCIGGCLLGRAYCCKVLNISHKTP